ncbi:hypothetical protein L0U85_04245 [Glycomyces sp. L485]|uniref:hypothetical protein n=1 Tax=Glycomyces sp. L485 TaxID=2909235 RepID=UPI001F4AF9D6|nr:hypothetical protein [Glycomyces sp. L485]MCH7230073.1 hypothetical protein [Glycomyces sp. L485]
MKIALDPTPLGHLSLTDMVPIVADLGFEYIELSSREDFMPFLVHPRAAFMLEQARSGIQSA